VDIVSPFAYIAFHLLEVSNTSSQEKSTHYFRTPRYSKAAKLPMSPSC
jgi:hypothetical protein